ncbi:dsDNA nuclease domain-containing protein [Clostridium butanoliproducens]|uniref:dsDNA nuclease domain-containing protein n=1 Tax=Clostridium butanoliproducens TaxID=2991837 RepID=UPI0024B8C106|nr:dsDNA nuclease domain-containing protein [Clostridium butanoliproducens]
MFKQVKLDNETYDIQEILKSLKNKQANNVIRGFYYQALVTIREWIECHKKAKKYKVYCEVEDDVKIEIDNYKKYVQVKCYKNRLSLKSEEVLKSLFTFLKLYIINKNKNVGFVFESNTSFCQSEELCVLKKWRLGQIGNIEIEKIRQVLIKKYDKEILNNIIYSELIKNNYEFKKFIKCIKFKLDCIEVDNSIENIKSEILENIEDSHIELERENYKNLFAVLLKEVMDKSSNTIEEDRVVDENIFKKCIQDSMHRSEEYKLYKEVLDGQEKLQNNQNVIINMQQKIYNNTQEIKESMNKATQFKKNRNKVEIIITSRENIEEDCPTLNLKHFFEFGKCDDKYRKINDDNMWNNMILDEIDVFFKDLIMSETNNKNIICLKGVHYSIAFYIGYKYGKSLGNPYLKRDEIIYKLEPNNKKNNFKLICEKCLLSKENDIAVIINTSRNSEVVKNQIKNFICKNNLKIGNIINLTLGENNNRNSIDKYNFYYIACEVAKTVETIQNNTIHLFNVTTVEEAFAIGRLLFDKKNIILYEYVTESQEYNSTIKLVQ